MATGGGMAEPFGPEGLPLEQARALILAALQPLGESETLALGVCLGRVSAAAVRAQCPGATQRGCCCCCCALNRLTE